MALGRQLDSDRSRQGLVRALAPLQSAATVLRQDLAPGEKSNSDMIAKRDRSGPPP